MRSISVEDAMTSKVETVNPTTSVVKVAKTMAEKEIGSVVVTQSGEAVGIICERDMLDKVIARGATPKEMVARDIMEKSLITIGPDADMLDAIRRMVRNGIGHLPVTENSTLVGIVTVQDALKATPRILETLPVQEVEGGRPGEVPEEGICEICGEVSESLREYNGRWICEDCWDFLTG